MSRGTKRQVMTKGNGVNKTTGGLTANNIKVVRKHGQKRYVSKKKSALAKKNFGPWNRAVRAAKKELGIPKREFVALKKGTALYKAAAKRYYK